VRRSPRGAEWVLIGGLAAGLVGLVLRCLPGASATSGLGLAAVLWAAAIGALAIAALVLRQRGKMAEAEDAASRRLLEIACDAVIVVAPDRRVVRVSPRAAALFGYPADELVGRPLREVLPDWSPSP